jgi:hypothetical protein
MRKLLVATLVAPLLCSPPCLADDTKTSTMLSCAGTMTVAGQLPQPAPFMDSLVIDFANMSVHGFTSGEIEIVSGRIVEWFRPYPANPSSECETGNINRVTGQMFAFVWITPCGRGLMDVLSRFGRGGLQTVWTWEAVCKPSSKLF